MQEEHNIAEVSLAVEALVFNEVQVDNPFYMLTVLIERSPDEILKLFLAFTSKTHAYCSVLKHAY